MAIGVMSMNNKKITINVEKKNKKLKTYLQSINGKKMLVYSTIIMTPKFHI